MLAAELQLLRLEQERRRRARAANKSIAKEDLTRYRFDPERYLVEKLGWQPWGAVDGDGHDGQREIIEAYRDALVAQHERKAFEAGELSAEELTAYVPGEPIPYILRVEAGHTVGKTKLAAGLVSHFFDTCVPSIIYSFAPGWDQIKDLLWKEIRADRRGRDLPGRILDLELKSGDNHFAKGRSTNNAGGKGSERIQGQHGEYLMFVVDEAEGVAPFVFDAIRSMSTGGIVIVIMLANPQTRTSRFHKARTGRNVRNFRLSCLHHPNVVHGREIIPGAVRRDAVDTMIDELCEVDSEHDEAAHTFEVPWRPGLIFRPKAEFCWRVLGIAPKNVAINTFVPVGVFEGAVARASTYNFATVPQALKREARMGVDVALFGDDTGTIYIAWAGRVWRYGFLAKRDYADYARVIKQAAVELKNAGVKDLVIRLDGGGGFGQGVRSQVLQDPDLPGMFGAFDVILVHNGSAAQDPTKYLNLGTQLYAEAAVSLRSLALVDPPPTLEEDMTGRQFDHATVGGRSVQRIEEKKVFKKRTGRSPDEGDGLVLAVAADHLFAKPVTPDPVIHQLGETVVSVGSVMGLAGPMGHLKPPDDLRGYIR